MKLGLRTLRRSLLRAILCAGCGLTPLCASANESPESQSKSSAPPAEESLGTLVIEIEPIPMDGTLYLELHDARRSKRWSDEPLRRERQVVDAASGSARFELTTLASGSYAVRVFLDQNHNERLDRSSNGIPLEPFGFSSRPRRRLGVPRIEVAAFGFAPPQQRIRVRLRTREHTSSPKTSTP